MCEQGRDGNSRLSTSVCIRNVSEFDCDGRISAVPAVSAESAVSSIMLCCIWSARVFGKFQFGVAVCAVEAKPIRGKESSFALYDSGDVIPLSGVEFNL